MDPSGQKEKTTFTKSVLSIIVMLYFIGAAIGGVLVVVAAMVDLRLGNTIEVSMFIAYASYIGAPTTTAIGFYAWKSKAENLLKIQNSLELTQKLNAQELVTMLANMRGE